MKIDDIPAHPSNYYSGRGGNSIRYIVVHYTANNGDTAANNGSYFAGANRQASAHYFVDETSVVQSVGDGDAAWHCGGGLQGAGGHGFHGKCTNRNSLGVEMCSDKVGGRYVITAATVERTRELARYLMRRYNVPASRVIRHYDVTGKLCPEPWVRNPGLWQDFKTRLEEDDMTENEVRKIAKDEIAKARELYDSIDECPAWARETVRKLADKGILQGEDGGRLGLTYDLMRLLVINDRAGVYDK